MQAGMVLQDRSLSSDDIGFIRQLIADHPSWHRTRLSQELPRCWDWTIANGQFKDMATRAVLRKLDARSSITLPPPVHSANNAHRHRCLVSVALDQAPITARLDALKSIRIHPVQARSELQLFRVLLATHHYLGYSGPVGENLQYLVFDRDERPLGCLLFGAAAWLVACRDRFIGGNNTAREQGLSRIANNMRFLILPWVRVEHLLRAVSLIRTGHAKVTIIARAHDLAACSALTEAGADLAHPEALEASLRLGAEVLKSLGLRNQSVDTVLGNAREEDYALVRKGESGAG